MLGVYGSTGHQGTALGVLGEHRRAQHRGTGYTAGTQQGTAPVPGIGVLGVHRASMVPEHGTGDSKLGLPWEWTQREELRAWGALDEHHPGVQ